jgi:DNA-binding PadR family transcriptional regulator
MSTVRKPLTDLQRQEFSVVLLLHHIASAQDKIHFSFLNQNHKTIEPNLKELEQQDLVQLDVEQNYQLSEKGQQSYDRLIQQKVSYQAHFEIYAFVDLGAGTFADPETDLLEDERWADLRVAVAEDKGIDPYRVVFLAMLSDESFFVNPDWYFDLAMGTLFDELESITKEQFRIEELGYEDEDENKVMGEEVIADVIEQGSQLAKERRERQAFAQDVPDEEIITTTVYHNGGWRW